MKPPGFYRLFNPSFLMSSDFRVNQVVKIYEAAGNRVKKKITMAITVLIGKHLSAFKNK